MTTQDYTTETLAKHLGVTVTIVRKYIATGQLEAYTLDSGEYRIETIKRDRRLLRRNG